MRSNSPQIETALVGVLLGVTACAVAVLASTGDSWPFIVLATVPLLVRGVWRSMPLSLLLVATAVPVMVAEAIENQPTSATWLIGCVALVVAAIDRRRSIEWIPVGLVVGGPLWLALTGTVDSESAIVGIWMMGLLLSATLGTIVGQQRRLIVTMRDAQVSLAAAAAADERHRIARDLHDIVGHSFSVVLLHLAGARHLMNTDHARAEAALRQAEEVGRQSMNDLRASLALLRTADDAYRPVGDLTGLHELVDGMRQAGLDVTFSSTGDLDDVDAAVGLVVYSVAREALTNAAKHAAPGPVVCAVSVDDRAELRVTNRTRPGADASQHASSGHGLAGMNERVSAVGGSLHVDNTDGEWTVVLDVPVRGLQAVR
ncbi:MAG: sensor histidine kinase [Acidimicrobiales bacterium]